MKKPVICLVMIVKDEEHVIGRCLRAVKHHIDCWVIQDTGSTDKTKEAILEVMMADGGCAGVITEEPFQGMSYNRTLVMEQARKNFPDADYLLMIDADDTWIAGPDFKWPEQMNHGAYKVRHTMGKHSWLRVALTNAKLPWEYRGAAHEFLVCEMPHSVDRLPEGSIRCGNDGARRKNEGKSKYLRIAKILEDETKLPPSYRRNLYYLAQSYMDGGDRKKAIGLFEQRATMGGWPEEVYCALFWIARLKELEGYPFEEVQEAYLRAYESRPTRAEPLHALAKLNRQKKNIAQAYVYASAAISLPFPSDNTSIDESVYSWKALDEYAVLSMKLNLLPQARDACLKILKSEDLVGCDRRRVEDNFSFSIRPITGNSWQRDENPKIAVVLSTYEAEYEGLRSAIESIFNQTYTKWELHIVSDGNDLTEHTKHLESIADSGIRILEDERVKLHTLHVNCGQFKIYDAMLKVTDAPLFAIQDDDDVSCPERFEKLVQKMRDTNADVVFCDMEVTEADGALKFWPSHPEWLADTPGQIVHVGSHTGLWKTESLKAIGGYYGGFDLGADTVVVGLMTQLGRAAFLRETLYKAFRSPNSMTTKEGTKIKSDARESAWSEITAMWGEIRNSPNRLKAAREIMSKRAEGSEITLLATQLRAGNKCAS